MPETAPNKDPIDAIFFGGSHPDIIQRQITLALEQLVETPQDALAVEEWPRFIPDERSINTAGLLSKQYGTNRKSFWPADTPTEFATRVLAHTAVTNTGAQFQTHPRNIIDHWGPEGSCR